MVLLVSMVVAVVVVAFASGFSVGLRLYGESIALAIITVAGIVLILSIVSNLRQSDIISLVLKRNDSGD